ncbi:MAG: hypothetical protein FWF08_10380 [Oscillospiraceae bacterium]|nr:hypothetical protein [Oscillospiraceae bacterium]
MKKELRDMGFYKIWSLRLFIMVPAFSFLSSLLGALTEAASNAPNQESGLGQALNACITVFVIAAYALTFIAFGYENKSYFIKTGKKNRFNSFLRYYAVASVFFALILSGLVFLINVQIYALMGETNPEADILGPLVNIISVIFYIYNVYAIYAVKWFFNKKHTPLSRYLAAIMAGTVALHSILKIAVNVIALNGSLPSKALTVLSSAFSYAVYLAIFAFFFIRYKQTPKQPVNIKKDNSKS